jgi:hypothetical protein
MNKKKKKPAQNPNDRDTITVNTCPQTKLQGVRINHAWKRQISNLIHIACQMSVCTPNQLYFSYFSPFNKNQANAHRPVYLLIFLGA